MTKAQKLRLALQAREWLEDEDNGRLPMQSLGWFDQKYGEALYTEYPNLSVLAHEVALEEESTKLSLLKSEEARERLRRYVETCEGMLHDKRVYAFGGVAGR